MFISPNKVRMHDTDVAGILYFPRKFRFVHEALEDLTEHEGFSFPEIFHKENFIFVIVHAEADYYKFLKIGDKIEVHVVTEHIGNTSFIMGYRIFRGKDEVGSAKTVHVTLDNKSRTKIPVPEKLRAMLKKHLVTK